MGGHFHDTGAGTATPASYEFAWNDDVIAMNQFAGVLTDATEAVAAGLNTQTQGTAVVVYNPLNIEREDVVEADRPLPRRHPKACASPAPTATTFPRNWKATTRWYSWRRRLPSATPFTMCSPPHAARGFGSESYARISLENARYRVTLDNAGDVSSIFDKIRRQRVALRAHPPRDFERSPTAVARLEHGFRPGTGRRRALTSVAAVRRRFAHRIVRMARRASRSKVTRSAEGSHFVADHQPLGRRCRQPRGIRQRPSIGRRSTPISRPRSRWQRFESDGHL